MTKSALDRQVELRLFDHEVRFTTGRRAVVGALADARGPLSAAELSEVLGSEVPLSSLYRSLSVLEEAGVVSHHLGAKGLTRYELAEWLSGHHHHLVCVVCGSVDDIEIPRREEQRVQALVDETAAIASSSPTDHALEIEGLCRECG